MGQAKQRGSYEERYKQAGRSTIMKFTVERNWIDVLGILWIGGEGFTRIDLNST